MGDDYLQSAEDLEQRIDAKIAELRSRSVTDNTLSDGGNNTTTVKEFDESHISQMSIYDYLVLCEDAHPRYKLAGMITNNQLVTSIAREDLDYHIAMFEKIFESAFSYGKYSINKMPNDIIAFYSTGKDFIIHIPDKISFQQYQTLLNIVNQVKRFETDYDVKVDLFDSNAILDEAKTKLYTAYSIESDEVIVGVPIKKAESEKNARSCLR